LRITVSHYSKDDDDDLTHWCKKNVEVKIKKNVKT